MSTTCSSTLIRQPLRPSAWFCIWTIVRLGLPSFSIVFEWLQSLSSTLWTIPLNIMIGWTSASDTRSGGMVGMLETRVIICIYKTLVSGRCVAMYGDLLGWILLKHSLYYIWDTLWCLVMILSHEFDFLGLSTHHGVPMRPTPCNNITFWTYHYHLRLILCCFVWGLSRMISCNPSCVCHVWNTRRNSQSQYRLFTQTGSCP